MRWSRASPSPGPVGARHTPAASAAAPALLQVLGTHTHPGTHAALTACACGLMRNLATHAGLKAALAAGGCIPLLTGVCSSHPSDPAVVESAAAALWSVIAHNDAGKAEARRCGAEAVLEDLADKHEAGNPAGVAIAGALASLRATSGSGRNRSSTSSGASESGDY
jgi:hypothetical protein